MYCFFVLWKVDYLSTFLPSNLWYQSKRTTNISTLLIGFSGLLKSPISSLQSRVEFISIVSKKKRRLSKKLSICLVSIIASYISLLVKYWLDFLMVTVKWLTFFISILLKLKTGLNQVKWKLVLKKIRHLCKE